MKLLNIKLKKYQKTGVKLLNKRMFKKNRRGVPLADDMGLGKTIQSLCFAAKHKELWPVIIVTPAVSKWDWQEQAQDFLGLRSIILEGTVPFTKDTFLKLPPFIIINYEILKYWYKWLISINAKLMLLDEWHYLKEQESQRTKTVFKIVSNSPEIKVMPITGTLALSRPIELWTLFNMLQPKKWNSRFEFGMTFCNPTRIRGKWEFKGVSNSRLLYKEIKRLGTIRRLKKNVMKELKKERIPVYIRLPKKKMKLYNEIETNFIKWLWKTSPQKAIRASKAEAVTKIGYLKRIVGKLKRKLVIQWIDNFLATNPNEKLVVFGVHKNVLKKLYEHYKNEAVLIDGSIRGKKRHYAKTSFQKNPKVRLLFGNINAAGKSITLTAASTMLFVELNWTPGEHTQAEDRICRITQVKDAIIYYMIALGTIEERLCKLLRKKQKSIDAFIDGDEDSKNLDIFDELQKIFVRKAA